MKKIISALILLVPAFLWSDTNTTGNLKLLKPSVGVVDTKRSSGDKLNVNFDIIDTSFTTLTNAVASSTQAIVLSLAASTLTLQNEINFISTELSTSDITMNSKLNATSSTQTKTGGLGIVGSFGVGIATPSAKFEVLHGSIVVRGNNAGIFLRNGNVGIGTLVPDVAGIGDTNARYIGFVSSIPTNDGTELPVIFQFGGRTELQDTRVGSLLYENRFSGAYSRLEGYAYGAGLDSIGFKFITANAGDVNRLAMKIAGDGKILIGTETYAGNSIPAPPSSLLHVSGGSITVTGGFSGITVSTASVLRIVFNDYSFLSSTSPPIIQATALAYSTFSAAQIAYNSNVISSTDALRLAITTGAAKVETYQGYRSTGDTQSQVFTSFMSTSNDQQDKFVRFNSTSDTHQDATLNFLSTAGVNVQNLNVFRTTTDTQMTTFQNYRSTTDSKFDTWANFRSTQDTNIQALNNFNSTSSTHQDATLNFLSTAGVLNNNQNAWLSTTTTELQARAVPLSIYDEGTSQGNGIITTLNCVGSNIACSQATATGTITITGSSGGGASLREYTIYLATAGAVTGSADIFDSCGSTRAIDAVGALGLLGGGSSVQATILVREGVYKAPNATTIIPNGIDFGGVVGSSTVWVLTQTNKSMFKVYGRLHDLIIDCSSLAITGLGTDAGILDLRQGGTLENIRMYNCSNHGANSRAPHLFISSDWTADGGVAPSSTVAKIKNVTLEKLGATEALNNTGDGGPVTIRYAQRVEIDGLQILGHGRQVVNEAPMLIMYTSSWVYFNNMTMDGIGRSMGFMTYGDMGPFGINNSQFILRPGDSSQTSRGVINFFIGNSAPTALEISTGMYITNSRFYNYTGGNFGAAWIQTYTTKLVMAGIISGNIAHSPTATTDTFIGLADSARNWTIADNYVTGFATFISDSGAGTKYTGLGNFRNSVEQ